MSRPHGTLIRGAILAAVAVTAFRNPPQAQAFVCVPGEYNAAGTGIDCPFGSEQGLANNWCEWRCGCLHAVACTGIGGEVGNITCE